MTYIRPKFRHPELPKNKLGYTVNYYEGALSTLCAGCGHDSISAGIIQACFELDIEPHRLAKLSGIADCVFAPHNLYTDLHSTYVVPGDFTNGEGVARPGHFRRTLRCRGDHHGADVCHG